MINRIAGKPYILFDGAMGTYFASTSNLNIQKCEYANLQYPEIIERIHGEYILAGAEAIKTNTFSANTVSMNADFDVVESVIEAGYQIALRAANGHDVLTFADIGPIPESTDHNESEYKRIIDTFLHCGAKAFLFETFSEYDPVLKNAAYVKEKCSDAFVLAQFAVLPDGYTRKGIPVSEIFKAMENCPYIDAYGLNCISGPKHIYDNIKKQGKKKKLLSAMPNAGYPSILGERTVYNYNAAYFASYMRELFGLGVTILGGCCGTTPEHIALTKKALSEDMAEPEKEENASSPGSSIIRAYNGFKQKLDEGRKVIAVELDPPIDTDIKKILQGARELKEAGADVITIADNPLARARADSALIAAKIKRECGIETLPHIACRDRNLNAIKGMLLGLHIEEIRNVLVVTGDPIPEADRGDIKSVYNLNSKMLAAFVNDMNQTVFAGDEVYIGGAYNVNARKPDLELKKAQEKVQNGVRYFLTQPIFSKDSMEALRKAKLNLDAKMLAGIMPVVSYRNACFINNEIPGIIIDEETIARYKNRTREEAEQIGIEISLKTIREIGVDTDGYYLITPLNRVHIICEIVKSIRREII